MSLCYDFQKWMILTLALVTISLTIGLIMQYAQGQNDSSSRVDKLIEDTKKRERYRRITSSRIDSKNAKYNLSKY
jgi:hypothetical protein